MVGLVCATEFRPLSLRPFDLNDGSGVVYGRGIYLIVLPSEASVDYLTIDAGGNFVTLKKSQGYDVELVYLDQIELLPENTSGIPQASDLKAHIMNFKEDNPMLEYVLLVGDVNGPMTIPTFTIPSYNEAEDIDVQDYEYTYKDDAYVPEFFLGRWPIQNADELKKMKIRSIQYVKMEYVEYLDELGMYDNALLVAGNYKTAEGGSEVLPSQWPVTPVWTSLWLYDELDQYGYSQIDTAFYHQGNYLTGEYNPLIASSWNQGVGIVNYRGWGNANGWHKPHFHRSEVEDLLNGFKLPIVMSFVCNTGDFGNDYTGTGLQKCFGEVLVTAGSLYSPKGATAVVAPSDLDTDTRFNNVMCGVMWDGLLEGDTPELAQALHKGKHSLIDEFGDLSAPDGTNMAYFYHHVYGVLGDPSLPVILKQPQDMVFELDGELHQSYVLMNLSNENAEFLDMVVGAILDENDELIGKGISDENGDLLIDFDPPENNSSLTLILINLNINNMRYL